MAKEIVERKTLIHQGKEFEWTKRRGQRTLRLRLSKGMFHLSSGRWATEGFVRGFLERHQEWMERVLAKKELHDHGLFAKATREDYLTRKHQALAFVHEHLPRVNRFYGFTYGNISIRCNKQVWGSCSGDGSLQFHYQILDLPLEVAEYLLIHELCHLKYRSHGIRFWQLVEKGCPEMKRLRKALRQLS
ncbi:MAG: M48 family metallopeptidase [Candidatus Magasanikbacteria bacterium]|nr:M48 family metallopeptidase [Candidatus Magasanikbacteria bacterium]MCA9391281.1 M48 family metallopeptidase [Candidatus Magasanikbacteria bacterium]